MRTPPPSTSLSRPASATRRAFIRSIKQAAAPGDAGGAKAEYDLFKGFDFGQ
jgi:hypothetical protein